MSNIWLADLEKSLQGKHFITVSECCELGIFGSKASGRLLISKNILPYVRVSKRRYAIPAKDLIVFLKSNFKEAEKVNEF